MAEPQLAIRKEGARVPALAMLGKGFKGYKPEKEQPVREVEVVETEALKQLRDAWGRYESKADHYAYGYAHGVVMGLSYSASDVEKFSLVLAEFQDENDFSEKAGMFLSALINNCNDKEFVIHTTHLAEPISYLGYGNERIITVKGNAGGDVGAYMQGGEIHIEGKLVSTGFDIHGKIFLNGELIIDKSIFDR
ncbi:MAG: hypothetical protein PHF60_03100 [Candidatus ainarchaeum sp.]|nr:hypothetical protein [Candidatus ainarchaeum sp.]